ncbi:MAG: rRNA maturation RNase YbeY [Albidovulum sp.]
MTATMEQLVDTLIEDPRWKALDLDALSNRVAAAVLTELGLPGDGYEISLLGCADRRIAELNADFRGKPQPTNVLSWPAEERAEEADGTPPRLPAAGTADDPAELGDIAIAWETCMREAEDQGKAPEHHVAHLLVHGILHLIGFDHVRDRDAALMEATEVRILAKLGIADPYE